MDIYKYITAFALCAGGFFLVLTIILGLIYDYPMALKAIRSEEGQKVLVGARARKQAKKIVKKYAETKNGGSPDALQEALDNADIETVVIATEEPWPTIEVIRTYTTEERIILSSYVKPLTWTRNSVAGICNISGGEAVELAIKQQ